jgi:hypothetical protein
MKAREFHDCGRRLSPLYAAIRQIISLDTENINAAATKNRIVEINKQYDDILDQCPENHEKIDLDMFELHNYKEFNLSFLNRIEIKLKRWYSTFYLTF